MLPYRNTLHVWIAASVIIHFSSTLEEGSFFFLREIFVMNIFLEKGWNMNRRLHAPHYIYYHIWYRQVKRLIITHCVTRNNNQANELDSPWVWFQSYSQRTLVPPFLIDLRRRPITYPFRPHGHRFRCALVTNGAASPPAPKGIQTPLIHVWERSQRLMNGLCTRRKPIITLGSSRW